MDKKAGGKIMINVLCTKEETFKNAVYTADKGVFSGVGTSKKFCSNEIGADAVTYILPEGIRENIGSQTLIMVNLSVKSNQGTGKIKINLTGDENCVLSSMEYAVPAQWTQIKTPLIIEDEKLAKIEIFLGGMAQDIDFANLTVEDYTQETDKLNFIGCSGMYLLEAFESVTLQDPQSNPVIGKTIDVVVRDNYIYAIGGSANIGYLVIGDVSDKNELKKLSVLEGLGHVRQVDITSDGKYVLITGRHYGVTIIDVTDAKNPFVKGYYDSVEFATGICVSENYMFVANRQYGVEIVDISDIDHPKHLSIVRSGEAQSCKVINGYLYAGIWGECKVKIYDVHQPSNPFYVGCADLNGRGDGFSVAKSGDGSKTYLYAATGQHVSDAPKTGLYTDPRYGMGNGMDIFDITEPANPKWLSTVKIDGKYYHAAIDFWRTKFSRNINGRDYAYLISTFNGIYVYDVTDPAMPRRLAHITIPVQNTSPNFVELPNNDKSVFQFDQRGTVMNAPVSGAAIKDGVLYIAGTFTDVHTYSNDKLVFDSLYVENTSCSIEKDNGTFYKMPDAVSSLKNYKYYKPQGQVYYALTCGAYIFAACGNDGIHVLDKDLNFIRKYETNSIVSHIQIVGDTLYTAENRAGLRYYKISGATLTPIGKAYTEKDNNPIKSIQISPNEKWAVVQQGRLQFEIVNIADKNAPALYGTYTSFGHLYYRNLMNGFAENRYMMCYANPGANCHRIIDFGVDCESDTPIVKSLRKTNVGLLSGMAAYKDCAVTVKNDGTVLKYKPADYMDDSVEELPATGPVVRAGVTGKPSVYKNIVMLSERTGGDVSFVDISNPDAPQVVCSFKVAGNPDLMTATDDYVLLPLGYQGLVKFDTDMFKSKLR